MSEERRLEYRPGFAPHVVGRYELRVWDEEAHAYEEQRIEITCEAEGCGQLVVKHCNRGRVREHVQRFALGHLHPRPPGNPGSPAPA